MENNGSSVHTADDHETGVWLLALTEPGKGYLGRVVLAPAVASSFTADGLNAAILESTRLNLCPVYDYREMVKEVPVVDPKTGKMVADPDHPGLPAVQPMRTPLVIPVGFTGAQAPVHVPGLCYGTVLRFLDEMDPRDKATYIMFAKMTRQTMQATRAQLANLVLPTSEEVALAGRGKA